jgi:hypothetical protein
LLGRDGLAAANGRYVICGACTDRGTRQSYQFRSARQLERLDRVDRVVIQKPDVAGIHRPPVRCTANDATMGNNRGLGEWKDIEERSIDHC